MRVSASALRARVREQVRDPSVILLATQLISIVLRLGSNLVLAHLLVPRDFGLLAITTLVATALVMVSETGVWVSIVRKTGKIDRDWLDQLWTLQAGRGVVLWLLAVAITPPIAAAYGEPQLLWLLPVANVWLIILCLESLQPFVRNKEMRPELSLGLQLVTQVVGSLVAIAGALIYPSPWALVVGLLAGAAASTVMGHVLARAPLPRPHITMRFLREQWTLTSWMALSSALGFFGGQIDRLLFPAWFGTTAFGVYGVALTLALFPLQVGMRWGENVYMPLIAKLSEAQSPDADKQLRSVCRTVVIYGAVGSAFLAGIGSPFFHALYPYRFALAGTYIQVLAVTTYATFITYLHRRMFLYRGMTRLEATIEGSRLVLFLVGLGAVMALVRRPDPIEYVALYAVVQVIVYGGLMIVGRIRQLVHIRDDLPGHIVFTVIMVAMIALDGAVEQRFGAWAALVVSGAIGGVIGLATAARLGLPKLPSGQKAPEPPPQDPAGVPEIFDPLQDV